MLAKLLTTAAMAAATWLIWRIVAHFTSGAAARQTRAAQSTQPTQPERQREQPGEITMVEDPETGAWRAEDEIRKG